MSLQLQNSETHGHGHHHHEEGRDDLKKLEEFGSADGLSSLEHFHKKKRSRKNLDKRQVEMLEGAFNKDIHPSKEVKMQLAASLGLEYNKIVKWFDNRRTKERRISLENGTVKKKKLDEHVLMEGHRDKDPEEMELYLHLEVVGATSPHKMKERLHQFAIAWIDWAKRRNPFDELMFETFRKEVERLTRSLTYISEVHFCQVKKKKEREKSKEEGKKKKKKLLLFLFSSLFFSLSPVALLLFLVSGFFFFFFWGGYFFFFFFFLL
jgi:hypothetical protein